MQKRFLIFYPKISIFVEQTTKQDYVMTEEKERDERFRKYLAAKSDQELVALVAEEEMKDGGRTMEELMAAGMEGVAKAREHYDETRAIMFQAYAVWWIRQAMRQA